MHDESDDRSGADRVRDGDAPQSTYHACLYELREYGVTQLTKPSCKRRLGDLSIDQVRELIAALLRLKPKYRVTINDTLILTLGELLP